MSSPKETDSCIPDTQETYYEGANEDSKKKVINETQSLNWNESQDFHLVDSEGDDSISEKIKTTQDEKNNSQESVVGVKQLDSQTQDCTIGLLQLESDDEIVSANSKEDKIIKNKEVLDDKSVKKTERDVSNNISEPEEKKEPLKENIQDVSLLSSSPSSETISNIEVADQESKVESSDKFSTTISKTTSENIITDEKKNEDAETGKLVENEPIKKTEKDISSDVRDSDTKYELSDDEVIQGTPPQDYMSTKSSGSVEVASLKRKCNFRDELPAKVPKMVSEDVTSSKKFEDEESRQSCESDDSYQDLFKNTEKNVIIEETQDPITQEFPQNSLGNSLKDTTDDAEAQEHCFEQLNQERDDVFSTKCCDMEKDENLNVSAKLTDTSANDSTIINVNSMNESNSHVEDNNLSVEVSVDMSMDVSVDAKENVSTTNIITVDEKCKAEIPDETDKCIEIKELETATEKEKTEEMSRVEPTEKIADKNEEEISITQTKVSVKTSSSVSKSLSVSRPRSSIELIYDTSCASKSEPEVVEIDEDDEKIVLDSSAEVIYDRKNNKAAKPEIVEISVDDSHEDGERIVLDSLRKELEITDKSESMYKSYHEGKTASDFSYKSMESMKESSLDSRSTTKKLVNGSSESKRNDTDATLNVESDTFSSCNIPIHSAISDVAAFNTRKFTKSIFLGAKDVDTELINISDEMSNVEEKKSDLHNSAVAKAVQMEREIYMYVKFKCTLHMDENTKEFLSKELTTVQCETAITEPALIGKQKNEDSQSCLADISDNKESSPGSVNSNPQLYQLNPSRLSMMSSISSSSSASSAASLAAKLNLKNHFSMPLGPAKHAKKHSQDVPSTMSDKQALDETYERLTHEWKNHSLLTTTILNCLNAEVSNSATAAVPMDTYVNVSNERLDDHHHSHYLLEKSGIRSSTPQMSEPITTPKSSKKKNVKRPRSKPTKSNIAQANGENNSKNISDMNMPILNSEVDGNVSPNRKKVRIESTPDNLPMNNANVSASSSPQNTQVDDLIGKVAFAKWSDNNYYPGIVSDRVKTKYKVNFFDGKSKMLISEFVIPIPKILRDGLSVYATTKTNDYGSCGIIVDVQAKPNDEDVYYTVETDEQERLRVQIQDIFLSNDQAQLLKEEINFKDKSSVSSTPKSLGQVTLDNMVEGKRRSKRIGTPIFSTPKSRNNIETSSSASKTKAQPSGSGISSKLKEKSVLLEIESTSSDSNVESIQIQDENVLRGVQKELIGTPYQQIVKGPQNRIKGKPRSKKKVEDEETIATLGPIPPDNSNIFKGMSFILTYITVDMLDRYQKQKMQNPIVTSSAASSIETEATETETENEDDWTDLPFVRERLHKQIIAGGGKIYEDFNEIPINEYKHTKLITNVPNTTAKSILCLSVGIPAYNHKWIIRCCLEGKLVNAAENSLPTGWSLHKKSYVEIFQIAGNKPLSKMVVIIPILIHDEGFITFWRQVCENAEAVILIAENSESMESVDFENEVVLVSNNKCPPWAVDRAIQLRIPMLSTTWVIQCLIEGKRCPYEQHPRYRYNYKN